MTEKIKYFALVLNDRKADNPHSVFREVRSENDYRVEVWDPALHAWDLQMSLMRYTGMGGEIGALSITEEAANRIIGAEVFS